MIKILDNVHFSDWCDPGYRYNAVTEGCDVCGYGYYRGVNDVSCIGCPAGRTTRINIATSITDCLSICKYTLSYLPTI